MRNRYYLVKLTSASYTFHSYHKIRRYVIKAGELVYDSVYLNIFDNFKQWYTPYEKKQEKNCQVEYFYFNQGKLQSINDVDIPDIA